MYLRQRDYDRVIKSDELQQYIDTDAGIQGLAYTTALAKVRAHLKQKYYVSNNTLLHPFAYDYEFSDTNIYSLTQTYTAFNRVELNFPAYVNATAYTPGMAASVTVGNIISQYICKTGTTGAFDATKWYLIGVQYDVWNLQVPYPLFNMKQKYKIGDICFWKGLVYQALQPSTFFCDYERIQALYTSELPYPNVFPDDPNFGATWWGVGVPYNVVGVAPNVPQSAYGIAYSGATDYAQYAFAVQNGILWQALVAVPHTATVVPGTNINVWQPITWALGDNRDQLIVDCLLHLVVYDITPRIMIDETPDLRTKNRDSSMKTLRDIEHGVITPDQLIPFQTSKGLTVNFGGASKRENQF